MTLLEGTQASVPHASGARWFGVYPALVTNIVDSDGQGRVQISLPWSPDLDGASYTVWARVATLMAGPNKGSWFVPDVHDEVLVAFEAGDPRRPYVVGCLWNGADSPPASMDGAGNNYVKVLRSRNGVKLTLDDTDGREQLVLETPGGQTVTLADGPGEITVQDSSGNTVRLDASGITVTSSGQVNITAATAELSAATLSVNAGMSTFSGVVQADTVITNAVVSASYTPGAGNIW
jgi:uncharacterized protein involved in type VI secretion and phage assembly